MSKTNVTVNHACGCSRTYTLAETAPHLMQRIVATLEHESCGACKGTPRRLLAKSAEPEGNGRRPENRG